MQRLDAGDPGFDQVFQRIVAARRESDPDVARDVSNFLGQVRSDGDAAIAELTKRFDGHDLNATGWRIERETCEAALRDLDPELRTALELAATRIRSYHETQKPVDSDSTDDAGVRLGARWLPVDAAGVYVPGGRAAYPSSVLMNALPAKVAGVERLVMVTPTPDGEANPLVLAAAALAGVDEVWRIGGAQAIAALAYGTEKIVAVDVVTGPGNDWVAEAKRQLYGVVGIDMVAGPSEILVIADGKNDPAIVAADLLSQAEHDPSSQSILITDSATLARNVEDAVKVQAAALPTRKSAEASWGDHGVIITVADLQDAVPLANRLAAEHLQLSVDEPETLFARIRHAGSVFLGRSTPEAVGDYVAGPNHVLPTGRRARFSSGLSVLDFMKRSTFIQLDRAALGRIGPAAVTLAEAEGLPAHAESVRRRLDR